MPNATALLARMNENSPTCASPIPATNPTRSERRTIRTTAHPVNPLRTMIPTATPMTAAAWVAK
ncbi:MAG: hypothetical protein AMXMBFR55_27300 [Gemmatimonadota bacterium]